MKLKIFNLLTASLATLGLLVPPASAFGSNIGLQASIKEAQPLKGDTGNSRQADREWTQNQRLVEEVEEGRSTKAAMLKDQYIRGFRPLLN